MSDYDGPPTGPDAGQPGAADPTMAMGAVPPAGGPPPTPTPTPGDPERWYHNRAALGTVIGLGLALLFLLIALIIWWASDDDDDAAVVDETTTTLAVEESTTTTETTVPETTTTESTTTTSTTTTTTSTTTTTVPETTTSVDTTTTTIPVVTVPPQPNATIWDVIVNSPDLDQLRALIELAGLDDELAATPATYTLFAPSNTAIENAKAGVGAPDFTDPAVVAEILRTHLHIGNAYTATEVLALAEVVVDFGGPHAVEAGALPPTIGGAALVVTDVETANGVIHVIDTVLRP